MIPSRLKVKDLCDQLMQRHPMQIVIDLIQDEIEEIVHADEVTPDEIGAASYYCSILKDVYNPELKSDIDYLVALEMALTLWCDDATFANKSLGLDPNA